MSEEATLPSPFVPEGVVLPDLNDAPVEIDFVTRFTPGESEAFSAALVLYLVSFRQNPAGSLPSDDQTLAELVTDARPAVDWFAVKERVLSDWTKCSDGRLYREYVAASVLTLWLEGQLRPVALRGAGDKTHALLDRAMQALESIEPESEVIGRIKAARGEGTPS